MVKAWLEHVTIQWQSLRVCSADKGDQHLSVQKGRQLPDLSDNFAFVMQSVMCSMQGMMCVIRGVMRDILDVMYVMQGVICIMPSLMANAPDSLALQAEQSCSRLEDAQTCWFCI